MWKEENEQVMGNPHAGETREVGNVEHLCHIIIKVSKAQASLQ